MKNFGAKWLALVLVTAVGSVAGMSLNGCSDGGGGGTAGTGGGGAGRGGSTGTAGRGGSGGTAGTTTGRGGSTAGTGGGTAGTGGGTAGTGGTSGATGTGGAAGGLPCPGVGTFDTNDMMGFALNTFMDSAAGATVNLAVREAGAKATLAWDGTMGDPTPGSLKVEAPFDAYKQMVDIQKVWGATMLKAWTGYKLHVRVKVVGGNPSAMNPMGIQPYVNTGATFGGYCGKYNNLIAGGGWNDYVLDLSTCTAPADPSMVIAFGVSIQTGDGSNGDGGVNSMLPVMATINVDSFWLEGSCGGTGGTGGGTAGSGGGTAGSGGRGGSGGTAGSGGATAGSGGATAGSGGATAGSGGATAGSGGATGGATAGSGGATGGTGGTTAALTVSNFDTTLDSFSLNTFMSTSAGAEVNLAVREAGTMATAAWDGTQGMGTPVGSARVSAPFDAYNQFFDLVRNFGATTKQDWTGKTSLKVRFKVMSGGNPDPAFPAGAQAYVQTTDSYVGIFGYNNVAAGTDWQVATVALNPATPPANWNLAQVIQVGIKITTGSGTGTDASVASGPPTAAAVFIDSVWAE